MGKVAIECFMANDHFYDNFCTMLEVQSQLQCINVVSLVGYCYDGHEMIQVHEYIANGSLFDRLHNTRNIIPLSWEQRLQICIGVARGLNYLHTGVRQRIFHRDVKSAHILLDQNWVAKISGFDVSLLVPEDASFIFTECVGTVGYMDPEYWETCRFTEKSDVYSFGVVLFEVLWARKAVFEVGIARKLLSTWAIECIEAGSVEQIIDPSRTGKILPLSLDVFVEIARQCVLKDGIIRPLMTDIVRKLEHALALQETFVAALENKGRVDATNYISHELFSSEWHPEYNSYDSSTHLRSEDLSGPR
ncbi:probable receptor-like protein kinase At5g59700 [Cornus florida]|uniref:probable receptor-like protein kinase At5g59700 n=1 Tax=Cornus florida TaxID=4283 RepID=UPI00289B83A6|nr:probable receptor-like protein kinase At5g59700 [Cornus florida]